nr:PREDICTED: uncharacterized protein LOC109038342 [Bemisia tabaci]
MGYEEVDVSRIIFRAVLVASLAAGIVTSSSLGYTTSDVDYGGDSINRRDVTGKFGTEVKGINEREDKDGILAKIVVQVPLDSANVTSPSKIEVRSSEDIVQVPLDSKKVTLPSRIFEVRSSEDKIEGESSSEDQLFAEEKKGSYNLMLPRSLYASAEEESEEPYPSYSQDYRGGDMYREDSRGRDMYGEDSRGNQPGPLKYSEQLDNGYASRSWPSYPPDEHFDDAEEEVEHTESYNEPESVRNNRAYAGDRYGPPRHADYDEGSIL